MSDFTDQVFNGFGNTGGHIFIDGSRQFDFIAAKTAKTVVHRLGRDDIEAGRTTAGIVRIGERIPFQRFLQINNRQRKSGVVAIAHDKRVDPHNFAVVVDQRSAAVARVECRVDV